MHHTTVAIKDLKVHFGNSNLLLKKSAIRFELLAQKREINKKMAGILHYQY